jgi:hypothetical protein
MRLHTARTKEASGSANNFAPVEFDLSEVNGMSDAIESICDGVCGRSEEVCVK